MNNNQTTFPAYRESSNKFYIPHYYGVENFGLPKEYKVSEGLNIDLEFAGILRDYQEPVVNKFINHCLNAQCGGGLLELFCAWGKTSGSLYILSKLKKKTHRNFKRAPFKRSLFFWSSTFTTRENLRGARVLWKQ